MVCNAAKMKKLLALFVVLLWALCPELASMGAKKALGALLLASNALQVKPHVAVVQRTYDDSGALLAEQLVYQADQSAGAEVLAIEQHIYLTAQDALTLPQTSSRLFFESLRTPIADRNFPIVTLKEEHVPDDSLTEDCMWQRVRPENFSEYLHTNSYAICEGIPLAIQANMQSIDRYFRSYGLVFIAGAGNEGECGAFREHFFLDAMEQALLGTLSEHDTAAKVPVFKLVKGKPLEFVCQLADIQEARAQGLLEVSRELIKEQLAVTTYDITRTSRFKAPKEKIHDKSVIILNASTRSGLTELVRKFMNGKTEEELRQFFQ